MRRYLLGPALGLVIVVMSMSGAGAQPQPQSAPASDCTITPAAGLWMICAASYSGPDAPELSRQMAAQIRSRYGIPAYCFNHADEERKKQKEMLDQAQKLHSIVPMRRRTIRVEEQCAVLVGGYPDLETARKVLEKIKNEKAPELKLASGRSTQDIVFTPDEDGKTKSWAVNPFQNAFVSRNPSLPVQSSAKVDPLWWKLNQEEQYSLLENPRNWTLVVKGYGGARTMTAQATQTGTGFLDKIWSGQAKQGDTLDATAAQAHELARVLRQLNFEAYVLHTRTSSIVTVGSFTENAGPEVERIRQQLKALKDRLAQTKQDPFQLYQYPNPMPVPRLPKQ